MTQSALGRHLRVRSVPRQGRSFHVFDVAIPLDGRTTGMGEAARPAAIFDRPGADTDAGRVSMSRAARVGDASRGVRGVHLR